MFFASLSHAGGAVAPRAAATGNLQHHFVLLPPPACHQPRGATVTPAVAPVAPAAARRRLTAAAAAAASSPSPGRDPTPGATRPPSSTPLPWVLAPPGSTSSSVLAAAAAAGSPGPLAGPGAGPVGSRGVTAAAAPADGVPSSLAWQVQRTVSEQPQGNVYTGPSSPSPRRVTLRTLRQKHARGEPITMVTAYDYPSAVHVDEAGIDIALVGDSVAMVVHGHDTTLPISMDEMLVHCRAAARGAKRAFLVGDMPFGTYETGVRDAVINAMRMLKEGGMDAVKLEGGSPARVEAARAIVEAGVAVMGHVGLTPQSVSVLGGFRPQAQVADEALAVMAQAQALQKAGCFALVLECVPAPIAAAVTASVDIPTIGIGAGAATSGQVLVYHDLLGMMSHPHHAKVTPKFCKQYAHVGSIIQAALQEYRDEVVSGGFPSARFSPYRIPQQELGVLVDALRRQGAHAAAQAVEKAAHRESQGAATTQQPAAPPPPAAAPATAAAAAATPNGSVGSAAAVATAHGA